MIIKDEIDVELWETIQKNYETQNYTGSILDSVLRLTDTIRNKTGLEGDGASLIGQAFGGDNPRIKLNKLQTDSEKDIQRGIQVILRGIYVGIRNPRSHDVAKDEKRTADAIIIFINYLLGLIDSSKLSFEENDFLARVFDPYYVKTEEYSDLLVKEIPTRQRANIAISVILRRTEGDIYALGCFLEALLKKLEPSELSRFFRVVSDELRTTQDTIDMRYFVHTIPGEYWKHIDQAVRIRTEAILFEDFSHAKYDKNTGKCVEAGALATWITCGHLKQFSNLHAWTKKAVEIIQGDDENLIAYVDDYFWENICEANKNNITWPLKFFFEQALMKNNIDNIERLKEIIVYDEEHPWWHVFSEPLKLHPDIKYDDCPF